MFKVYSKLLKYVPEKKYLAYIAILLSVISAFATAGAYYYLFLFLNQLICLNSNEGALNYGFMIIGLLLISSINFSVNSTSSFVTSGINPRILYSTGLFIFLACSIPIAIPDEIPISV